LGNKKSEVIEVPDPEPKDDLVVVKMMSSVVCGSEHPAYHAPARIPIDGGSGHEGAGLVWKTDRASRVKEGDRVTIYPTVAEHCHHCPSCATGDWQHCEAPVQKRSLMGTHTQYMLVPEYVCLPIPEDVGFDAGAMIGDCVGTPYRAIRRLGVKAGETVLITGAGPIGAAAAVISNYRNALVIVADVNDYRLEQARKNGADYVLNPERDDVLAKVREISGGGVDCAIDCSGNSAAQLQCLDAVKVHGRVAFLGLKAETIPVNMTQHLLLKELTLIGSWASSMPEHFEIVDLIQRGMPIDKIITHQYGIDDSPTALNKFFDGEAVKVAIHPWDGD
jgi:threonine dehydrogenase-like Zn-dependent dehydrogenase